MAHMNTWLRRAGGSLALTAAFGLGPSNAMAATPVDQVTAHLAAGEFGPAAEIAASVADPTLQAQLLQQIANEQVTAGARDAARGTLRQIRTAEPRREAQRNLAARSAQLSGGAVNLFDVIQVIQTNTGADSWEEDGGPGTITPFPQQYLGGGIKVSPNGLLDRVSAPDATGRLQAVATQARRAALNANMAKASRLRLVSLNRLQEAVAQRLTDGLTVPESMAQLAGLSQIQYVFLDPQSHDIIIGGPAEAWQYTAQKQPVGVSSGRPTLQLDDLVTVLRTFERGETDFGCTIETRDAGVQALQEYVQQSLARGPLTAGASVRNWVNQLQKKLGRQDITVWGVPSDSRVARVIVEADYRLKLIGIDKLDAGKAIPSYFDLLPAAQQKNAQAMETLRWWLTMKYDAVVHSPDRLAYEIQGSSVLCQSENQFLTAEGKRVPTGQAEATNRAFAETFTQRYSDLSRRDLAFADMQNVFDLAMVAALIHQERAADHADWDAGAFAAEGVYRTAHYAVPKEIDSVVNHRVYNGRDIVVQVAGGVRGDVLSVVKNPEVAKESADLARVGKSHKTPELPAGRWWWDAEE